MLRPRPGLLAALFILAYSAAAGQTPAEPPPPAAPPPAAPPSAAPSAGPTMLSTAFTPKGLAESRTLRFESLLDAASQKEDFVGLAVAVVRGGEIAILKTYGVTEVGGTEPVTAETIFRLASLSKGFAASLAALAMEEGRIAPETPVAPYAPRFALKGGAEQLVTVNDILSHRVGLPPNAYDNLLEAGVPASDILARYRSVAPICKVGTCYAYQNVAFNLIGDVLAKEYGAPYEDLIRARIFEPLGMRGASFGREALGATGDWARPHSRDRIPGADNAYGPWRIANIDDAYYRVPAAGGVNASISDMARWLAAQMGWAPAILSNAVLTRIHAPVVETRAETRRWSSLDSRLTATSYGYGWRIYQYAGETVVTHSGGVEGYGAQIAFIEGRDVGIVILANTRAKRVWRILPAFLDIELGLDDEDWLEIATESGDDAGELEELGPESE